MQPCIVNQSNTPERMKSRGKRRLSCSELQGQHTTRQTIRMMTGQREVMMVVVALVASFLSSVPGVWGATSTTAVTKTAEQTFYHDAWTKISSRTDNMFSARNGHATCEFQGKLWVVGGRSAEYQTWNLQNTERNADVWHTTNGVSWKKVANLSGDFEVQNWDVKAPGPIAPWYARYGHSLDAMDITGDKEEDVMVLAGGYTPQPANDVWVTVDGEVWEFVDYAPWAGRAWHSSAIYNNSLFILGGTPLNNEVWEGKLTSGSFRVWYGRAYLDTRWHMSWRNLNNVQSVPWAPRAGHRSVVQCKYHIGPNGLETVTDQIRRQYYWSNPEQFVPKCYLYVIGGYGGWNSSYYYYNGIRSKNDVWYTDNGVNWTCATHAAPWAPRAFHDVQVWHDPVNHTQDVVTRSRDKAPRLWLTGGGYMGQKDNSIVYMMKGYVDMWWTRNGADWYRVDWEQGSGDYLYSTDTWAKTTAGGSRVYLGKWGHRLQRFIDPSGNDDLYVIGGTAVGSGDMVQDVFKSSSSVVCDINGRPCSGKDKGDCLAGLGGCVCKPGNTGEYCEHSDTMESAASRMTLLLRLPIALALATTVVLLLA